MADGTMSSRRAGIGNPWLVAERILVVRADNIGDIVMVGPALRALKARRPAPSVTLLASPAGTEAAPLLPWLDDVITWRVLWQDLGRLEFDPARESALFDRLRRGRFDAAIVLTSFSQTPHPAAFAACMAGIALRAGCSRQRSGLLTDHVPHGDDGTHQVERNLMLIESLGFDVEDPTLELRVPAEIARHVANRLTARGVPPGGGYVVFNPWASAAARTYSPERGAEACRRIANATGMPVVITAHARDRVRAAELATRIGPSAIDLSGETSVPELASLVAGARLAVTGNTSVMHLADAFGTPAVVPYAGTDLESQWAPRRAPHRLLRRPTACSPCYALECPTRHECLDFAPQEVARAALDLLDGIDRRAAPTSGAAVRAAAASGRAG